MKAILENDREGASIYHIDTSPSNSVDEEEEWETEDKEGDEEGKEEDDEGEEDKEEETSFVDG